MKDKKIKIQSHIIVTILTNKVMKLFLMRNSQLLMEEVRLSLQDLFHPQNYLMMISL